jgi:hypothetical protein
MASNSYNLFHKRGESDLEARRKEDEDKAADANQQQPDQQQVSFFLFHLAKKSLINLFQEDQLPMDTEERSVPAQPDVIVNPQEAATTEETLEVWVF